MSMYSLFATDPSVEQKGVVLDYGSFRVTIARSGGANKRYAKRLEAVTKPYRRAIETETIDEGVALGLMQQVAAETIVLNWEVKEGDKWVKGIEMADGSTGPFTVANLISTFKALPDLYQDLMSQAGKVSLFRKDLQESDSKN